MTRKLIAALAVALPLAAPASAAPVDFSSFVSSGLGTWTVAPDGSSVSNPTFSNDLQPSFFSGGGNVQGQQLEATLRIDPASPQQLDRIGFALGLSPGENFDPNVLVDYWLIDWQGEQKGYFTREILAGLALSHVTGRAGEQLWTHNRLQGNTFASGAGPMVVEEVARGATLGATGWTPGVTNDFRINFTATLIEIFVGDTLEISHAGNFTDGSFGFYSQGQPGVAFTLASEALVPGGPTDPVDPIDPSVVPLPAGFSLMLAALGMFGLLRRRAI